MRTATHIIVILSAAIFATVGLTGCDTTSDERLQGAISAAAEARMAIAEVDEQVNAIEAAIDEQRAALSTADGAGEAELARQIREQLDRAAAFLDQRKAVRESLVSSLDRWEADLAKLESEPAGVARDIRLVGSGIASAAPALPPPWNAVAVLAGTITTAAAGGIAAYQRRRRLRAEQDAESIVRSIEEVKIGDGVIRFSDPAVKRKLNVTQTPGAKALVQRVTSNRKG